MLADFVTSSVTTHPNDGTVELKGMLDDIAAKPVLSGGRDSAADRQFQRVGLQAAEGKRAVDAGQFTHPTLTKNLPLGIHADNVQVTGTGVVSPLLEPERHHPGRPKQRPLLRQRVTVQPTVS